MKYEIWTWLWLWSRRFRSKVSYSSLKVEKFFLSSQTGSKVSFLVLPVAMMVSFLRASSAFIDFNLLPVVTLQIFSSFYSNFSELFNPAQSNKFLHIIFRRFNVIYCAKIFSVSKISLRRRRKKLIANLFISNEKANFSQEIFFLASSCNQQRTKRTKNVYTFTWESFFLLPRRH